MPIGGALRSCTTAVAATNPIKIDDQDVILIDTPGCDGIALYDLLLEINDYLAER
jgi:hypothetical protein